ncbi:MAG: hypothetical protein OEM02_08915 [Desulfobulbaceae bacterium]|nr:hypothetical protein [Desulfobulbaceae bacterium]
MNQIISFFLKFTDKQYSTFRKLASMIPGIIVFLVLSPFVIFHISAFFSGVLSIHTPRIFELVVTICALLISIPLMFKAFFDLWIIGEGSPAPIAPTKHLVTTGAYSWCRNPIELGTNLYFLALGIFFDSLTTGIFCMLLGLTLGTGYIKLIEEKEMLLRFGSPYKEYLKRVPFMTLPYLSLTRAYKHE